jgi:hypothetical protein
MDVSVTYDIEEVKKNLENFDRDLKEKIEAIFLYNESWAEAWMKLNAPWTDDTGAARSGLSAHSYREGSAYVMVLAYSVHYGIWLEVANSGRFQILGPAQRAVGAKILSDLKFIVDSKPPTVGNPTRVIPPVARKTARKGTSNKSGSRRSRKAYGRRTANR